MSSLARAAGLAAPVVFVAAVAGFGAVLDGYSQVQHPVSLLGGRMIPVALAFNLLAFVVPGVLAGVVALDLRRRIPNTSAWAARIGAQAVLLSAIAFIALGLLPLDPQDLETGASRLHGSAWMLWLVAFVVGALLLAAGLRRESGWAPLTKASAGLGAFVLAAALLLGEVMPAAVAQRLAFAGWFAWLIVASRARGR